jgi:hypothetical protein
MTKIFLLILPVMMLLYPPKKTIHLFNGRSLDGWYTFIQHRGRDNDPNKVFTVKDHMIRVSGEEYGCLTSDREYGNYELDVEFRWGGKTYAPRLENARDNGILLHSTGEDGGYEGMWMHSIECQIIEGGTGDLLVVGDGSDSFSLSANVEPEKQDGAHVFAETGKPVTINGGRINWYGRDPKWADVKGFRGKQDVEKPMGEWNHLVCRVEQNRITITLNGRVVNKAFDLKPSRGRIQIQSEGAEIYFRKVNLTPLD